MESFKNPEKITEEAVIAALNRCERGSQEAFDILFLYSQQCQAEADQEANENPGDPTVSDCANIKAAIKYESMLLRSEKYKADGLAELKDTLEAAKSSLVADDLVTQIQELIQAAEGDEQSFSA
jgi:hypothetical protein